MFKKGLTLISPLYNSSVMITRWNDRYRCVYTWHLTSLPITALKTQKYRALATQLELCSPITIIQLKRALLWYSYTVQPFHARLTFPRYVRELATHNKQRTTSFTARGGVTSHEDESATASVVCFDDRSIRCPSFSRLWIFHSCVFVTWKEKKRKKKGGGKKASNMASRFNVVIRRKLARVTVSPRNFHFSGRNLRNGVFESSANTLNIPIIDSYYLYTLVTVVTVNNI